MPHNFNQVQRASEGRRYGDTNDAHVQGVRFVCEVLKDAGYGVRTDWPLRVGTYIHEYDIVAYKEEDFTCWFQPKEDFPNLLVANQIFKEKLDEKIKFVIEIDGMQLHSKKQHRINDGVAEGKARHHMPNAKFLRLDKEDCVPKYLWYVKEKLGI